MARCERCNGCQSMWETANCEFCNYPGKDSRALDTRVLDDLEMWLEEEWLDGDSISSHDVSNKIEEFRIKHRKQLQQEQENENAKV